MASLPDNPPAQTQTPEQPEQTDLQTEAILQDKITAYLRSLDALSGKAQICCPSCNEPKTWQATDKQKQEIAARLAAGYPFKVFSMHSTCFNDQRKKLPFVYEIVPDPTDDDPYRIQIKSFSLQEHAQRINAEKDLRAAPDAKAMKEALVTMQIGETVMLTREQLMKILKEQKELRESLAGITIPILAIGDPQGSASIFLESFKNPDKSQARQNIDELLRALIEIGPKFAIPTFQLALQDPDAWVRKNVASHLKSLAEANPELAAPVIQQALKDSDIAVQMYAQQAAELLPKT